MFSAWDEKFKRLLFDSIDYQEQLRLEAKKSEFLALQNQINLHFLYDTLEVMRSAPLIYGVDVIISIRNNGAGLKKDVAARLNASFRRGGACERQGITLLLPNGLLNEGRCIEP